MRLFSYYPNKKNIPNPKTSKLGFSLVELMAAMAIFGLAAIGITAMVIQMQKLSKVNTIRNTAYTAAQAYLEQIKDMSTDELLEIIRDPTIEIPTQSITVVDNVRTEASDPLTVRTANYQNILMNIEDDAEGNPKEMYMSLLITPTLKRLSLDNSPTETAGIEIKLDFEYSALHLRGGNKRQSGSVRILKLAKN